MNKIILHAQDLDGFLTEGDKKNIESVHALYEKSLDACRRIDKDNSDCKAKDDPVLQLQKSATSLRKSAPPTTESMSIPSRHLESSTGKPAESLQS